MTTLGYIGFMALFFVVVYAALWSFDKAESRRQRHENFRRGL